MVKGVSKAFYGYPQVWVLKHHWITEQHNDYTFDP